jgi:hypothetical protein
MIYNFTKPVPLTTQFREEILRKPLELILTLDGLKDEKETVDFLIKYH